MQYQSSGGDTPEVAPRSASTDADDPSSAMLQQEEQEGGGEAGLRGQMSAVWGHKLSKADKATLRHAAFPRLCIHGRQDIVAAPSRGRKVADEIAATLVLLEGAHFLPRERGHEVRRPVRAACVSPLQLRCRGAAGTPDTGRLMHRCSCGCGPWHACMHSQAWPSRVV